MLLLLYYFLIHLQQIWLRLLMSLPRQGQIKVAGTLTCQPAEVSFSIALVRSVAQAKYITQQLWQRVDVAATAGTDQGRRHPYLPAG